MEVRKFVAPATKDKTPSQTPELIWTIVNMKPGQCFDVVPGTSLLTANLVGLTLKEIDGREFRRTKDARGKSVFVRVK